MRIVMPNFMRKSYRNTFLRMAAGVVLCLLFVVAFPACVDVDNTFGKEYLPNDQYAKVVRDSTFTVKTYNVTSPDSLIMSGLTYTIFGSMKDEAAGTSVSAGVLFQMRTPTFKNADSLYGVNPVIDSALLTLNLVDWAGKIEEEQDFEVFELTERIWVDSTYYADFDADAIREPAPLFEFKHSGEENIEYWVENQDFLDRLLDTTGYWRDSLFKERFKGFYLRPKTAHEDGAMYQLDLDYSSLQVFYHNENSTPDTTYVYYNFYQNWGGYNSNQSINVVDWDFSGVNPDLNLDDPESPAAKTFVQSYGGILTKLEFTEDSVESLKQKVKEAGYSKLAINKAKLEIFYPARTPELLDDMHTRLGMYLDYRYTQTIADFDANTEIYMRLMQSSNSYVLPYGGLINRSLFHYEMDITGYVQNLFSENYDKREVILGPTYEADGRNAGTSFYNINTSALDGFASEEPIRLVITYTMLR